MLKLFVLLLATLSVAKGKSQCETKHNIVKEDWDTLNADTTKPSEKMMCLFKCIYEEKGITNSEGILDVEKLVENTCEWKPLNEDSKKYVRECVKDLGPVKKCSDVNPSFQCVHQALDKQEKAAQ